MKSELEDARKLAHGTYNDVIVAEHRQRTSDGERADVAGEKARPHLVLELPEGSRVIDWAQVYEIDGAVGSTPPKLGASFRLIVGPSSDRGGTADAGATGSLRYETPGVNSPGTR